MNITKPQKMIYNMVKVDGDSIATNCSSLLIDGEKSISEIQTAVNGLFYHNDILRVKFIEANGILEQEFCDFSYRDFEVLRFENKEELDAYAENYVKEPLIYTESVCDFKIVILNRKYGLLVKLHHIISDAWTFGLIFTQFDQLLNKVEIEAGSYSDYVESEKNYLVSNKYEKDKSYFLKQIEKCDSPVYLSDKISVSPNARRRIFVIEKNVAQKIRDFAKEKECSVFSLFSLALAIYISKIKVNAEKLFIGTTILNRNNNRELNTAGIFINSVPMLFELDENKTFEENLDLTEDSLMSLFRHQKYSYNDLLLHLSNENYATKNLYDVMINYMNAVVDVTDKTIQSTWYYNGRQHESLVLNIDDRDQKNVFKMHYDYQIEKFTENDIENLHDRLCRLIFDAIENPCKKIGELNMLSEDEKQKILCDFNDTKVEYDKNTCVYKLFEQQAEKNPDKTALVFKNKRFTYSELYSLTEEYAGKLVSRGIKPDDTVAVHLERSHMLVVLQMAVLKIGGIFLPVDKRYPEDRINYACKDCNVKLFITDENISPNTAVISIAELENVLPGKTETVINNDSCYIIYTSGSTGKPKGCFLTGKGLLNFCLNNNTLETLDKIDSCTFASVNAASFDYFIAESLLPLTNGFATVILDDEESTIQQKFISVAEKNNINVVMTTPTRLKIYFDDKGDTTPLAQLKCICTSGEPLTAELLSTMYIKSPGAKVYNPIGPSECSVWDMGGELNREDGIDIHIGKPIANVQIYITDKYMNPVPIGVTGEICIAGDGVGAGYINNPDLTAEKFIDNPFGEGKLYKTGDLAYWREDGNIVFVGRNDFQVKIRGLRIELGEIESAISDIDGINMSVVVVRKDCQDRQLICAFYTGEERMAKELRKELERSLPKYMVPHIFTHLEKMPLTSSGKINREDLPEIDLEGISTEVDFVASYTHKEKALEEVVCAVLNLSTVSMLDNFFDLGGDSIKAIYIVSALEEKGYGLSVADIMQKDTLSDIAEAMKEMSDREVYAQGEVNGFVPFTPVMRAYLKDNGTISADFAHTCVFAADCDEFIARNAIELLISHHDILRGSFCEGGIEIHSSDEREIYSFSSIYIDDKNKAEEYLKNTMLKEDKLVNVVFCRTAEENLIGITVHHFLIDLVSWEILIKDFQIAVKQLKNKEQVSLPAKTASFKLWSEMLYKYSERIPEESRIYLGNISEKLKNVKSLCLHKEAVNEAEVYNYTFDKDISDKLINDVRKIYNTKTNEVLLTALGLAACEIVDGSAGIIVESHGRAVLDSAVAVDRTVGWFTSCYPVVIDDEKDINQALISIKEELRNIPANGIGYLLMSHGLPENADIIFNFYENSTADKTNKSRLVAFDSGSSAFPGKISVDCIITNGILTVKISVSESAHKKGICKELGEELYRQLMSIVDLCVYNHTVIQTPSDFSDDELTQDELNELKDLFEWTDIDEEQ